MLETSYPHCRNHAPIGSALTFLALKVSDANTCSNDDRVLAAELRNKSDESSTVYGSYVVASIQIHLGSDEKSQIITPILHIMTSQIYTDSTPVRLSIFGRTPQRSLKFTSESILYLMALARFRSHSRGALI